MIQGNLLLNGSSLAQSNANLNSKNTGKASTQEQQQQCQNHKENSSIDINETQNNRNNQIQGTKNQSQNKQQLQNKNNFNHQQGGVLKKEKKDIYKLIIPEVFKEQFDKDSENKWKQVNVDITDFFSYGFCEQTFLAYANKCRTWRAKFPVGENYDENKYELNKINDNTPLEYGGCSNPYDEELLLTPQNYNLFDHDQFISQRADMVQFIQRKNILTRYVQKHDEEQQDNASQDDSQERGYYRGQFSNLNNFQIPDNYVTYKQESTIQIDFIALQQQIMHNISQKNEQIHQNDAEKIYFLQEIFKEEYNNMLQQKNDTNNSLIKKAPVSSSSTSLFQGESIQNKGGVKFPTNNSFMNQMMMGRGNMFNGMFNPFMGMNMGMGMGMGMNQFNFANMMKNPYVMNMQQMMPNLRQGNMMLGMNNKFIQNQQNNQNQNSENNDKQSQNDYLDNGDQQLKLNQKDKDVRRLSKNSKNKNQNQRSNSIINSNDNSKNSNKRNNNFNLNNKRDKKEDNQDEQDNNFQEQSSSSQNYQKSSQNKRNESKQAFTDDKQNNNDNKTYNNSSSDNIQLQNNQNYCGQGRQVSSNQSLIHRIQKKQKPVISLNSSDSKFEKNSIVNDQLNKSTKDSSPFRNKTSKHENNTQRDRQRDLQKKDKKENQKRSRSRSNHKKHNKDKKSNKRSSISRSISQSKKDQKKNKRKSSEKYHLNKSVSSNDINSKNSDKNKIKGLKSNNEKKDEQSKLTIKEEFITLNRQKEPNLEKEELQKSNPSQRKGKEEKGIDTKHNTHPKFISQYFNVLKKNEDKDEKLKLKGQQSNQRSDSSNRSRSSSSSSSSSQRRKKRHIISKKK